ncbi:nucleotide-diphospho-sugar transferase [Ochromonadaceae sp. CCMP2298]|nr:nucleotide-diphospho-sugar transferase [Ochromonadaceae sp. CCMP2298]
MGMRYVFVWFLLIATCSRHASSATQGDTMNVVLISCNHRGMLLSRILLSSILHNKETPELLNITVIGDTIARDGLQPCTAKMSQREDININHVDLGTASVFKKNIPDSPSMQRFQCAYVKLELAFILTQYNHTIYIDSDTLLLEDIATLWNDYRGYEPAHLADKATLYIARGSESIAYTGFMSYKKHYIHPGHINTGVLFMNLFKLRQQNMTLANFLAVIDERDELADNDILETWAYYNLNKFGILPCKWNKVMGSGCPDHGIVNGIIHGANGNFERPRLKNLPQDLQDINNFYERQWNLFC